MNGRKLSSLATLPQPSTIGRLQIAADAKVVAAAIPNRQLGLGLGGRRWDWHMRTTERRANLSYTHLPFGVLQRPLSERYSICAMRPTMT